MNMLEYKGYHATVKYDTDDDILVGEVFGINDTLCFHGSSLEELKEMFRQSIDNYLELCVKVGKQPEKEYSGSFNIRMTPDLHKRAAFIAAEEDISLNQLVSRAVEEFIKSEESFFNIPI